MTKNTKQAKRHTPPAKPSKMPDTIGGQLIRYILDSGLSSKRLQKETGVHNSMISRFLRGDRSLSLESIDAVAKYLKLRLVRDED